MIRVVANTTDTVLEDFFLDRGKLYPSHINPELGVKRRDGDHSKLYHTNY